MFGNVANVVILESGSKKGIHLKILVEIDLNRPLMRETKLKFNEQEVWVDFKYENLAQFDFYCGRIGHSERNYWVRKGMLIVGNLGQDSTATG